MERGARRTARSEEKLRIQFTFSIFRAQNHNCGVHLRHEKHPFNIFFC